MKAYEVDGVRRPQTRAECVDGPRPCPWVSCRHHLLIEIANHKPTTGVEGDRRDARPTTIRLNRESQPGKLGRRVGLRAQDPAEVVRAWIRNAVEHLDQMPYTCSLDVADSHAEGYAITETAKLLGVTPAAIKQDVACASQLREALAEYADHTPIAAAHVGNLAQAQTGGWRIASPTPTGGTE